MKECLYCDSVVPHIHSMAQIAKQRLKDHKRGKIHCRKSTLKRFIFTAYKGDNFEIMRKSREFKI